MEHDGIGFINTRQDKHVSKYWGVSSTGSGKEYKVSWKPNNSNKTISITLDKSLKDNGLKLQEQICAAVASYIKSAVDRQISLACGTHPDIEIRKGFCVRYDHNTKRIVKSFVPSNITWSPTILDTVS